MFDGVFISGRGKIGGGSGGGIDSSEERAVSAGTWDEVAAGFWDKIAAAVWDEVVAGERELLRGELRSSAYEDGLGVEGGARIYGTRQEWRYIGDDKLITKKSNQWRKMSHENVLKKKIKCEL